MVAVTIGRDTFKKYVKDVKTAHLDKIINVFKKSIYFQSFSEDLIVRMAGKCMFRIVPSNTLILREGDESKFLYFIIQGRAKIIKKVCFKEEIEPVSSRHEKRKSQLTMVPMGQTQKPKLSKKFSLNPEENLRVSFVETEKNKDAIEMGEGKSSGRFLDVMSAPFDKRTKKDQEGSPKGQFDRSQTQAEHFGGPSDKMNEFNRFDRSITQKEKMEIESNGSRVQMASDVNEEMVSENHEKNAQSFGNNAQENCTLTLVTRKPQANDQTKRNSKGNRQFEAKFNPNSSKEVASSSSSYQWRIEKPENSLKPMEASQKHEEKLPSLKLSGSRSQMTLSTERSRLTFKPESQNEILEIGNIGEGNWCGEEAYLEGSLLRFSVVTSLPSEVAKITIYDLKQIINEDQERILRNFIMRTPPQRMIQDKFQEEEVWNRFKRTFYKEVLDQKRNNE